MAGCCLPMFAWRWGVKQAVRRSWDAGCHPRRHGYIARLLRRRDGRVAEGARLESVYTGNRIVGSNPTPSARTYLEPVLRPQPKPVRGPCFGFLAGEPLDSDRPSTSENVLSQSVFLWGSVLLRRDTVLRISIRSLFQMTLGLINFERRSIERFQSTQ